MSEIPSIAGQTASKGSNELGIDHFQTGQGRPLSANDAASSTPPHIPGPGPNSTFAETIAALQLRLRRHDTARAARRLSDAVVRGAASGLALRGGLHLVSYILGLLTNKSKKSNASPRPALQELLKDTLRWGAFLGCFSGAFVGADEAIACLFGTRKTAAWRALVSGALAGPALLLTGPNTTHTSLALYVFLRGLTLLVRCGNLPTAAPWKRRILAPTRWKHGDTFLMCLSTCQFGYSWIVMPSTLPASYVRFLNKHGGKEMYVLDAIRELCGRSAAGGNFEASRLVALQGTPHEHFTGVIPCEFLHPGLSCNAHTAAFIPEGYFRALPVYLPVYVIPAALVHRQNLLKPGVRGELWKKVGIGALRSSLVLTLYCALAWRGACAGWTTTGRTTATAIVASCWVAGLATLVEKKSRRMELALYCLSRSVEAFSLTMVAHGWINPKRVPRRLDVMLFSAATAAICHCYSDHFGARRDVFKSKYLTVFDFVFGNQGFEKGGISHAPSNVQLATLAWQPLVRSMRSMTNISTINGRSSDRASPIPSAESSDSTEGCSGQEVDLDGVPRGRFNPPPRPVEVLPTHVDGDDGFSTARSEVG